MPQSVSTTNCKASCNVTHWMTSWKASSHFKNQSISLASHPSRPSAEKLMECKSRRSMSLWSFERWFKTFIKVEIQGERSQLTLLFAFPFILWLIFPTLLESNLAKFLINIRKKLLVLMVFACSKRGTIVRVVICFDGPLGALIKAMSYIKKGAIYVESRVCNHCWRGWGGLLNCLMAILGSILQWRVGH